MAKPQGYSKLQIGLHWLMAFLIFGAFFTHEEMHKAMDDRVASGVMPGLSDGTTHTMLGGAVMLFVIIRLVVRWRQGVPDAPAGTDPRLAAAAHWGHILLYVLMLSVPIGGASAWYLGLATVGDIHGIAGKALMLLVVGHIIAALLHEAFLGDGTLSRMFQPRH